MSPRPDTLRIALHARSLRPMTGSARLLLGLTAGLAADGHRVDIHGQRLDHRAIRAAGGHPVSSLPDRLLPRIGERLVSLKGYARRSGQRFAGGHYAAVIGDGATPHQDAWFVHNLAARELALLGAAADPQLKARAIRQTQQLRQRNGALLVANSRLVAEELITRHQVPVEDVLLLNPAVDKLRFRPDPEARCAVRAQLGIAADTLLVGFITSGNFPLRGVDTLTSLLGAVAGAYSDQLRLLTVGHARNLREISARLATNGSSRCLLARPRRPDIERYLQALDLLIHPARCETFGFVVAEAAACGCPVLTSRQVGAAELFTGVGARAVTGLAEADQMLPVLEALLLDPGLRAAVANEQRAAVTALDWHAYARQLLAALSRRTHQRKPA
ncbi:MAG: glycosyltransferase family 4 protein [Chromatiales bacterium]|nr:glycosyltransferase family 4 protein [Chromatiales bacterium]